MAKEAISSTVGATRAYRAGAVKNQKLFGQHNAHWIGKGVPGEGRVLVFNNGMKRIGGAYSTVDEIVLPIDDKGRYERTSGKAFGPEKAVWSYFAPKANRLLRPVHLRRPAVAQLRHAYLFRHERHSL